MADNEEFEVDKIVAQRNINGTIEYRIRWRGYGPESDTWEPESHLIGCEIVLAEFKINNGGVLNKNDIKKDFEDGEVSETDSSVSDESTNQKHKKSKKKGKKKKSRRKGSSKSVKKEESYECGNSGVGIKIETPLMAAGGGNCQKEKRKPQNIQINLTMGASEILLKNQFNYGNAYFDTATSQSGVKQELLGGCGENESSSMIKEELYGDAGGSAHRPGYIPMQAPVDEESDEEDMTNNIDNVATKPVDNNNEIEDEEEDDDCDLDLDLECQLRVVLNDEAPIEKPNNQTTPEVAPLSTPINDISTPTALISSELNKESEKARLWREQLDTGTYKIRKSQRKDDPTTSTYAIETIPVLAKDKWSIKPKDTMAEAFYNLPVLQSLVEAGSKIENQIEKLKVSDSEIPNKEQVYQAIEQGNGNLIWKWFLQSRDIVNDGEFLLLASRVGFTDIATLILRSGTDVNYRNEEGTTPLMFACEYGHEVMAQLLIVYGAHINVINKKNEGALMKSVMRGHKECLVVLLQSGCDIFSIDSDQSPLMVARQRNLHEMELLISDYHTSYSERLTESFVNQMNSCLNISYIIFPLRVVSQYEAKEFLFEFNAKIPPVRDDECNLLAIFSSVVGNKQMKYCLDTSVNVDSVVLNEMTQQSLFESGSNCITSMSPIVDDKNTLKIKAGNVVNCRWIRLMVIGFRVKLLSRNGVK